MEEPFVGRYWTARDAELAWSLAKKGLAAKEIAERVSRSEKAVRHLLRSAQECRFESRAFTDEEDATLHSYYPSVPTCELARVLRRGMRQIYARAATLGLRKQGRPGARRADRRYPLPAGLFETLDWISAYALGLMAADGSVNGARFALGLKERDHLELVARRLGIANPLSVERKGRHVLHRLSIFSAATVARLRQLGVTERKSLTVIKARVPDHLLSHYVRGFFDGDGSASYSPRHGLRVGFVAGNAGTLAHLRDELYRVFGIFRPGIKHDKGRPTANRLVYYGDAAVALAQVMYRDCGDLLMLRKRLVVERAVGGSIYEHVPRASRADCLLY